MRYLLVLLILCACDSTLSQPHESNPPIDLSNAFRYLGYHEVDQRNELKNILGVDPVRTEWCAAFVNTILSKQNIPGSESTSQYPLTARSFLTWGEAVIDDPQPGDIVVFPRGNQGWQGHVGFYIETRILNNKKYYVILGGNQSNTVSLELYRASHALGIRRYYQLPPLTP